MDTERALRILAFSDWRIQPLELIDILLDKVGPVDVILYAGDDIARFTPPIQVDQDIYDELDALCHWNKSRTRVSNPKTVLKRAQALLGRAPYMSTDKSPWDLDRILKLFRPLESSRLSLWGSMAQHGAMAVLGNDCHEDERYELNAPHVVNLHQEPVRVGDWGVLGIEGSIFRREENGYVNYLGLGLSDAEIVNHLETSLSRVKTAPSRTVIVSHTPPFGCLDVGLRYGLERLGSKSLRSYIEDKQPALVVCGHCHSCGGQVEAIGETTIINVASDDHNTKRTHVAIIDLNPDEAPRVEWLDPIPHHVFFYPDIGPKRADTLASLGIHSIEQLYDAEREVLRAIRFGDIRTRRLRAKREAMAQNCAIWSDTGVIDELATPLLFYDVETGLPGEDGPQEPWLISAKLMGKPEVIQWMAPKSNGPDRNNMYQGFRDFLNAHPEATLCSWSNTGFDHRAVTIGMSRWYPDGLPDWYSRNEVDLLTALKQSVVLPLHEWSLKTVARWCGFTPDPVVEDLGGFLVGLAYDLYRSLGEPLDLDRITRYGADDVRMLEHVVHWATNSVANIRRHSTDRFEP